MKSGVSKRIVSLAVLLTMLVLPLLAQGQRRTKPRLKRAVVRKTAPVGPLVPIGTNLKIRLEDSLSSKESQVGDKFTATVLDPVRFNEGTVTGHISSIRKSGKVKGRTSMNLAFDSIALSDGRKDTLHGYVTRVYGSGSEKADNEGGVESGSRTNQALKRGGIGAAGGAAGTVALPGVAGGCAPCCCDAGGCGPTSCLAGCCAAHGRAMIPAIRPAVRRAVNRTRLVAIGPRLR